MKEVFEQAVEALPYSLDDLAEEYDLQYLVEMYEAKEQGLILMELDGVTMPDLNLHDRNCLIVFTYRDDFGTADQPIEGFQLDLFDKDSDELLLSCYHASSGEWPERFDISGGKFFSVDEEDPDYMPWEIFAVLMAPDEPDEDDFPTHAITSPRLH